MKKFILIFLLVGLGVEGFADSLNVTQVGFYDTPGEAWDVAVAGSFAYVADAIGGLRVINVANPVAPTEVGFFDTPANAWDVAVLANYAYVADGGSGLRIINITNPAAPFEEGFCSQPPGVQSYGVAVQGTYAYMADLYLGLRVINIFNPSAPLEVGFLNTFGNARDVAVQGTYAYVAGAEAGLRVIDITNPTAPIEVGFYDSQGDANRVVVSGNYAYVAAWTSGLRIINITNPASPTEAGFYDTPSGAIGLAVSGNYAYVADYQSGLRIINITNPAAPTEVGFYNTPVHAFGVAVSGNFAYVADYNSGIWIYDVSFFEGRIRLLYPIGSDSMQVFSNDTIRWVGDDSTFVAVHIELNRHYPIGAWETITDSTENDGAYEWFVTDPLSDSCRIRICALTDTFCDVSDGNFSIVSSQGYLALVRSSQPNTPVTSWDAGSVECPQSASQWFRLKNFGSESIVVFQPLEPVTSEFSRTTTCGAFFALTPNQISACSLRVTFDPASDGEYSDGLRIQTDAVNGVNGFVEIALTGEQVSTPAAPEVVITTAGLDAHLNWAVVDTSVGGCAVSELWYAVFYSPTSGGPFYYHGWTSGLSYTHLGVVNFSAAQFYQVVAVEGPVLLTAELVPGMEMGEVLRRMKSEG